MSTMIPVRKGDVALGRPLPYSLYDGNRKLLLREGVIVQTVSQLEGLAQRGLFRATGRSNLSGRDPSAEREQEQEQPGERAGESLTPLDEIKIRIGETLQLQTMDEQNPIRYNVKLIGYFKGQSVIVSTPVVDGKVLLMRDGQSFIVRLFSGKSVYAFTATTIRAANTPFPHLHLSYPAKVRGVTVRRSMRVTVNLIASVHTPDGKQLAASVADLSKQGALLTSRTPLGEKGGLITIKFRFMLDDVEQLMTLGAVIRVISQGPEAEGSASTYHHGCEFTDIPPQNAVALSAYVYQKLLEQSADI